MAKHYVKLNEEKEIIEGYSDEFPIEPPLSELICINEEGGRHFSLLGEENPNLKDGDVFLYRYERKKVFKKSEEEIQAEQGSINASQIPPVDRVTDLEHAVMDLGEIVSEIYEKVGE